MENLVKHTKFSHDFSQCMYTQSVTEALNYEENPNSVNITLIISNISVVVLLVLAFILHLGLHFAHLYVNIFGEH